MTGTHFSQAFLATIPPHTDKNLDVTDPSQYDDVAARFERVQRNCVGGFAGLLAAHRQVVLHGRLPEGVRVNV